MTFCLKPISAAAAIAAFLISPFAQAQVAPARAQLENFDKREVAANKPVWTPARSAALDGLRKTVRGLKVETDPLLQAPVFFSAERGFLSDAPIAANAARPAAGVNASEVVRSFFDRHAGVFGHGGELLVNARVTREFTTAHNGLKTIVWQQEVDGIPVFEGTVVGHVTGRGALVNLTARFLPDAVGAANKGTANRAALQQTPVITAREAIAQALRDVDGLVAPLSLKIVSEAKGANLKQRFIGTGAVSGESMAELVWLPMGPANLKLCWQVQFTSRARGEMFKSLVDATTGEVLLRHSLTHYISDATYNVYTSDSPSPFSPGTPTPSTFQPPLIPRVLVTTSAVSVAASPNGWINDGDTETLGNNVDAHLDRNDDDQPDLPRPDGGAQRVFDFPLDLTQPPSAYGDAAVVQLFYWNNWMHDKLYELGFTEAAGNFQLDNFGRGGLGNDRLLADAQDGLDLTDGFHQNNANMSTPADGLSPRMQMYKFTGPNPDRDGDLDAEIILHEYTHGLSNRRVGNGAGIYQRQSAGMGEGWSDFYALCLLSEPSDDINGTYPAGAYASFNLLGQNFLANYYFGIRRYPYSTDLNKNPLTFKDIDPAQASAHPGIPVSPIFRNVAADEVHAQGEVWCSMLWEARAALITKFGAQEGNQMILQLVTDGMNLSPPNPNFVQARDAILQADEVSNGGANRIEIFTAFAKRGLGALATSPSSATTAGVVESFAVPGLLFLSSSITGGNGNGVIDPNECNNLQLVLTNIGLAASNISVVVQSATTNVTITQPASTYPDVPEAGSAQNTVGFRINTSAEFICGTPVALRVIIQSSTDLRTNLIHLSTGVLGAPVRFDNTTAVNIPDADPAGVSSPIVVSNFSGTVGKVTVAFHLTHTFDGDLLIELISPDGTTTTLSANNGGAGDNFGTGCSSDETRTRFDDASPTAISAGTAPFVGVFRPEEPLAAFNLVTGTNANGLWRLKITDQGPIDLGTLHCWSLSLLPTTCSSGTGECPGSDLEVAMTATPDPAVTATNLNYDITVRNYGPSAANSVVVSHSLPDGVIFVSATNSQGTAQSFGDTVTLNFGRIAIGGSATARVVVIPTAAGPLLSTAAVRSEQPDGNSANDTVTVATRAVLPSADLALELIDSPDPVAAGGQLTYSLFVTNNGPIDASDASLTNELPESVTFISASTTRGTFIRAGNVLIFSLGDLAVGEGAVATVNVRAHQIGSITASAQLGAEQNDSTPGNNVATAVTTVSPAADLALTLIPSPRNVVAGSNVVYSLFATNLGPHPASGVVLNGTLPGNATFVTNEVSQGTFERDGNTFQIALGNLSSGDSATVQIEVTSPPTPQNLLFSANISGAQADPDPANNSASASVTVAEPFVRIVPAGARLVAESFSPANGSVDPGETVTVQIGLRNSGNINATNVIATLSEGGGVTSSTSPQNYGVLLADGPAVVRAFTFTVTGAVGETVVAAFVVQNGDYSTNVNFTFHLPRHFTFANPTGIIISNTGPASPYPSSITVSGITGLVSSATITLHQLSHSFPDDIDILLVGPAGQTVVVMSDAGGGGSLSRVDLTLDASASAPLADEGQLVSGSYQPADYPPEDFFPNAPTPEPGGSLASFANEDPNGVWSLYVLDDTDGDVGVIEGGWSLSLTTISPVNQIADLNLAVMSGSSTNLLSESTTLVFTVTNQGPAVATSVLFSNTFPAAATLVSASEPLFLNGSVLMGNLGDIAPGSGVSLTIEFRANSEGSLTNRAVVSSGETDVNLANNSVTAVTEIELPLADLALGVASATTLPFGEPLVITASVTNRGPQFALGARLLVTLDPTLEVTSIETSQGSASNSSQQVTATFGVLSSNGVASVIINARPTVSGTVTNALIVFAESRDPDFTNNNVASVTTILPPAPLIVAAGARLLSENLNANGTVDPGETVSILLALANVGTTNSIDLVATLLETNGVINASAPQSYGTLAPGGGLTERIFTFTAETTTNEVVSGVLQLQDGANDLGTVSFTFRLPLSTSYSNATALLLPNKGPASLYPSIINVSGLTGLVSSVRVRLKGMRHSFPDDFDVLLVGPAGRKVMLLSDAGGAFAITNLTLELAGSGLPLPDASQLSSQSYQPADFEAGESLPAPAPVAPYGHELASLNGGSPNGAWSLYVADDSDGDVGEISGGWELELTTIDPINPVADVSVTILSATPSPVFKGERLTYSLIVSNHGPSAATSVVVSNLLPAAASPISATSSQGDFTIGSQAVVYRLGTLAVGATANLSLQVTVGAGGTLVNAARVRANEVDLRLGNNNAERVTEALVPVPARLGSPTILENGSFQFTLTGQAGLEYRIEVSSNLVTWIPIATNSAGANGMFKFTDPAASAAEETRFYRAVRSP